MSNGASIDPLLLRQLTQLIDQSAAEVADGQGLTVDQWRMVEQLARGGADTTDRRKVVLRLSPRGHRLHSQLAADITAEQDRRLRNLDSDERKLLVELLHRATSAEVAAQALSPS